MSVRTSVTSVTFARPFALHGFGEAIPAGTYEVETDEERVEGPSSLAWRRTQTIVHLHGAAGQPGRARSLTVDPAELDAALARDRTGAPAAVSPPPAARTEADRRALERAENEGMIFGPHLPPADTAEGLSATGLSATGVSSAEQADMDAYGITRVPVDYFHYGAWRYTSLKEATAQARREARGG